MAALDGFALGASALCMIHCLALPLLMAALPMLADGLFAGEAFHLIVLALAIPTSGLALASCWRQHRAAAPLAAGCTGLAMMALALTAGSATGETAMTVAGSLLLAAAHIANWRARSGAGAPPLCE